MAGALRGAEAPEHRPTSAGKDHDKTGASAKRSAPPPVRVGAVQNLVTPVTRCRYNRGMSDDLLHSYRRSSRNWVAILFIVASALLSAQRIAASATADMLRVGCLPMPWHTINGKPVSPWVERYIFWNGR
jgi:hypothetical protein